MKKVLKEIIEYLLIALAVFVFILFCFLVSITAAQQGKTKLAMVSFIAFLMGLAFGLFFLYVTLSDKMQRRIINRRRRILDNKKNKETFDYLMIDAIDNTAKKLLADYIDSNNKNNPYSLSFRYHNKRKIRLIYFYQGFSVIFKITNENILVFIDSPDKYDLLDNNKELESKKTIKLDINKMSLEDVYEFIAEKIKYFNSVIKNFVKNNKPDNQVNGKTVFNIEYRMGEKKLLVITSAILAIMLIFIGGIFIYNYIIGNENFTADQHTLNIIGSIFFILIGLVIFGFSFKSLYRILLFKKDKKVLKVDNAKGQCVKVRFYIDGVRRSTDLILKTITLHLKNENRIEKAIIIIEKRFECEKLRKNKIRKMLIGNTYSLQCLKHSRFVLTGASKIVSEINEMA